MPNARQALSMCWPERAIPGQDIETTGQHGVGGIRIRPPPGGSPWGRASFRLRESPLISTRHT